jgi:HlyD family secretion protein
MKKSLLLTITIILVFGLLLSACQNNNNDEMIGSGTLSAVQVNVIPEVNGKILSIEVQEGQQVNEGDVLIKLDDEFITAQVSQAEAAKQAAEATLEAANQQLAYAQAQYDVAVQSARYQTAEQRNQSWAAPVSDDFRPNWYFEKEELIAAANAVIESTLKNLETRKANLEKELNAKANEDFIEIEQKLAEAQTRLTIAQATLAKAQTNNEAALIDAAESAEDLAQSEFDTMLKKYNDALTTSAAETILEARAQLAAAQSSYDYALDYLMSLQTGEDALQVRVAETAVKQAEAAVTQAEGNLAQADAALNLANLQLDRTHIKAPISGTVIYTNVEVGDMAVAGGTVMTIAELEELELFVYVPETWYGQIFLGDKVDISVDSFPSETFKGEVVRIADKAEYTPRNVQSADGRATTVYAIKILVPNPNHRLKPGMPADVDFGK